MSEQIETKIKEILESDFETPSIIKTILKKESEIAGQEGILGLVSIEREYLSTAQHPRIRYSPASLILATRYGLIIVEEGLSAADIEYGGYRIRYIRYSKISCLELDTCLLLGLFKISVASGNTPDMVIEFDTAKYFYDFEALINVIRFKMRECEINMTK